jgi:hypothetical protein
VHPVTGVPVHRRREGRSPLRFQQRRGGRRGVRPDRLGDEETADERRLKLKREKKSIRRPPRDFLYFRSSSSSSTHVSAAKGEID